jgi:hypothetical protein
VISLGGGPGFDYIALALLSDFLALGAPIRGKSRSGCGGDEVGGGEGGHALWGGGGRVLPVLGHVFDYEQGWEYSVGSLSRALGCRCVSRNVSLCQQICTYIYSSIKTHRRILLPL